MRGFCRAVAVLVAVVAAGHAAAGTDATVGLLLCPSDIAATNAAAIAVAAALPPNVALAQRTATSSAVGDGFFAAQYLHATAGASIVLSLCPASVTGDAQAYLGRLGVPHLSGKVMLVEAAEAARNLSQVPLTVAPRASTMVQSLAQLVASVGWRNMAVFTSSDAFGDAIAALASAAVSENGLTVQTYRVAAGQEAAAVAGAATEGTRVNAVLASSLEASFALLAAAQAAGLLGDSSYVWLASRSLAEASPLDDAGALAAGVANATLRSQLAAQLALRVHFLEPAGSIGPGIIRNDADFWDTISPSRFPSKPSGPPPVAAVLMHDAAVAAAHAINTTASSAPATLAAALLSPSFAVFGASGRLAFNPSLRARANASVYLLSPAPPGSASPLVTALVRADSQQVTFFQADGNGTVVPAIPFGSDTTAPPIDKLPVVLNLALALERSGTFRGVPSQEQELAFQAAIELLNEQQSTVRLNAKIVYDVGNACASAGAYLAQDTVAAHAIIGPGPSSCAIAMSPPVRAAGLPQVSFAETSPQLSNKTLYPTFFRIPPSDVHQGSILANLANRMGWKRIGVIGTTDAYGNDLANSFEGAWRSLGGAVARSIRFDVSDTQETVNAKVAELKSMGSAVNVISSGTTASKMVMAAAVLHSMTGPGWTWLGVDGSTVLDISQELMTEFQGLTGLQPKSGSGPVWEAFKSFEGTFQFNKLAQGGFLRFIAALHDAIAACKLALERQLLVASLQSAPDLATTRRMILEGLRTINETAGFFGAIGATVWFDAQQDGPVLYDVVNLNDKEWQFIGSFASATGLSLNQSIVWSDNSIQAQSDVQPADPRKSSSDDGTIVAIVLTVLGVMALLVVCLIWFYRRKAKQHEEKGRALEHTQRELEEIHAVFKIDSQDIILDRRIDEGAEGSFGEVWLGTYMHKPCAIKVLREALIEWDEQSKADFDRECQTMRMLRHRNLVLYYGAGVLADERPFLVTELCGRGSLSKLLLSEQTLPVPQRLRLAADVASGMAFLHSKNRIHRDLKSDNVLITDAWVAKVADFGTLKELKEAVRRRSIGKRLRILNKGGADAAAGNGDTTGSAERDRSGDRSGDRSPNKLQLPHSTGSGGSSGSGSGSGGSPAHPVKGVSFSSNTSVASSSSNSGRGSNRPTRMSNLHMTKDVGTLCWMSPEALSKQNYLLPTDVYSFGIILWEMAHREVPYADLDDETIETQFDLERAIIDGLRPTVQATAMAQMPTEYKMLMTSAWAADPSQRPSFARLADRLTVLAGSSAFATAASSATREAFLNLEMPEADVCL